MNSLLVFVAGLTAASGLAAIAQAQSRPSLDEAFDRLDANHDGKLDRQEFARLIEHSRSLSGSDADEVLRKLDVDKDGALTIQEFKGVSRIVAGKGSTPAPKPEVVPAAEKAARPE